MHRSRGEGREHPACPRPSALKCIFSLTCNTVLLSQTMSVFDQFLYPRHCCAERDRRGQMVRVAGVFLLFPDRPLIPYKFLECLRPRKPAPGRGRHQGWGRGWGPSPASPPHHQQLTHSRSPVESGCSWLSSTLWGSPASALHSKPVCLLLDKGVSSPRRGCTSPQTHYPSPKGKASTGATGGRENVCP